MEQKRIIQEAKVKKGAVNQRPGPPPPPPKGQGGRSIESVPWHFDFYPGSTPAQDSAIIYAEDNTLICSTKGSKAEAAAKMIVDSVNKCQD